MKGLAFLFISAGAMLAFLVSRARASVRGEAVFDTPNPTLADLDRGPTVQPLTVGPLPAAAPAPVAPIAQTLSKAASDLAGSVRKVFALPPSAAPYAEAIRAAEAKYGLPESLLGRVLWQESRFRPDIIEGKTKSSAGAIGIAQFMPATARDVGVDPLDPWQSIDGAARYLRSRFDALGAWDRALAAYNWGIGNVQRRGMQNMPAETRAYVTEILRDVQV